MRKVTDLIVKGRYFFLTFFIVIAILCLFLANKVNINEDIMAYLPKTSETKIGKDIMDKEFSKEDSSVLNVMFKGLSKDEKHDTLEALKKVAGVSEVSYEDNEKYNKDEYTLYVLNVDDYSDSKVASNVYNYVNDHFKVAAMSGSIYDENKPILALWIVILAILSAMVILTILSDSYVLPWLYLLSIGIAVFINKGTNVIFPSVSSITDAITAILQLALSMDYSIMLSNRYEQEKETHTNKVEAMKEALYQSFKAISSSSVTTIVGLLALVFMSFTIGRDLGLVLAKGVLLSLISIFFCLPALLLMFDNLITKTKKKTPKFNLTALGNFIYKMRYVSLALIIILFVASYHLKGNINVLFTASEQDKVGKIFPPTNQMAIVYNNKYEDEMASLCHDLEKDEKIDEVLCYTNTIGEKLTYEELNPKFIELNQDVKIDNYLIKLLYYHYYNLDENNKMSLNEFINFIEEDVYTNPLFSDKVDRETRSNLDLLKNFTDKSLISKKRSIEEIASILNLSEEDLKIVFGFYKNKQTDTKMTISEFGSLMLNDVLNNSVYSKNFDQKTRSELKRLTDFSNISLIDKKMGSRELASILGSRKDLIEQLFLLYHTTNLSETYLTLKEFVNFALELSENTNYKGMFNDNVVNSLELLKMISDEEFISKELNLGAMQDVLSTLGVNIDSKVLMLLYNLYTGYYSKDTLTINEFVLRALNLQENDLYKDYFNEETINALQMIITLNTYYDQELSKQELYQLLGISEERAKLLTFVLGNDPMSLKDFVDTLLNNKLIVSNMSDEEKSSLMKAQMIMENVTATYDVSSMASFLSLDKIMVSVIYGNGKEGEISFKNLIKFLYENKDNLLLKPYLDNIDNLDLVYTIISNINKTYNAKEISNLIDTSLTDVMGIMGVYDYIHNKTEMTPLELTNFILNNKDNSLLKEKLDQKTFQDITLVNNVMTMTKKKMKVDSKEVSNLLNLDNDITDLLFSLYNVKNMSDREQMSLHDFGSFIINDGLNNKVLAAMITNEQKEKLKTIKNIMDDSLLDRKYTSSKGYASLSVLSNNLDKSLLELVYMYYGSKREYDDTYQMTILEFVNYLNDVILKDERFTDFISREERNTITKAKELVNKSKNLLVSSNYSRVVLNTKYASEDEEVYKFVNSIKDKFKNKDDIYVVGNSPMAVEMSKTFNSELNKITILTMIFIFIVVAFTFKDLLIPLVLVLIIETAVYLTMSGISVAFQEEYFISILIVQAILMGATIDYAIVYTSYYRESRLTMGVKNSIINAYNRSIHTIISSSSILIIVTLIVAGFASVIAGKICQTISEGTIVSVILILFILPGVLACCDKLICHKGYYQEL